MLDRGGNKNENDKIKGNNLEIGALKIYIYFTVVMLINPFSLIKNTWILFEVDGTQPEKDLEIWYVEKFSIIHQKCNLVRGELMNNSYKINLNTKEARFQ